MVDHTTRTQLAELRRRIKSAEALCNSTLTRHRLEAETTPFLADCARELEALAGVCRTAASNAAGDGVKA